MATTFWNQYEFLVPKGVYLPAEDTYLLLEYLAPRMREEKPAHICEIGCGSGIVGISLVLESSETRAFLIDIDPYAVEATKINTHNNQVEDRVEILASDLFTQMPEGTLFDWIIFNPPYLPASGDVESPATKLQTEGGPSGLRVIRRFLEQVPRYLKRQGKVFFIASSLSPLKFLARLYDGKTGKMHQRQAKHAFFEDIILFELEFPER